MLEQNSKGGKAVRVLGDGDHGPSHVVPPPEREFALRLQDGTWRSITRSVLTSQATGDKMLQDEHLHLSHMDSGAHLAR